MVTVFDSNIHGSVVLFAWQIAEFGTSGLQNKEKLHRAEQKELPFFQLASLPRWPPLFYHFFSYFDSP